MLSSATSDNPADEGTRPIAVTQLQESKWIKGPDFLKTMATENHADYELLHPEDDKEVRPTTQCLKTFVKDTSLELTRFQKISSWIGLVRVISLFKKKNRAFKQRKGELSTVIQEPEIRKEAEEFLVRESQQGSFREEIIALNDGKPRVAVFII